MGPVEPDDVVVETSVWVDYFRDRSTPQTEWLDRQMNRTRLGSADLTLCEVLQGIARESEYQPVRQQMMRFTIYNTGGEEMAVASAVNYRTLRARGITIRKTIDCVIATYCIRHRLYLLHSDRDFDAFELHLGLLVVHPPDVPVLLQ